MVSPYTIEKAAEALRGCKALLVGAGAGMGVDSGLPDFRGSQGFWRAYPVYKDLGLRFDQMADPQWFHSDPSMAWGFYGHRLGLYRETMPHRGFEILRRIGEDKERFVFTSNVDGQFQKAGWDEDEVHECHGSIHWMQCLDPCCHDIWEAGGYQPTVDLKEFRATGDLPVCPQCGGMARPNILMFGDWSYLGHRSNEQYKAYNFWLSNIDPNDLVVVEIGAGTAIPSVRGESENLMRHGATLIRVNPRESHGPYGTLSFPMGGLEAMELLEKEVLGG